MDKTVLVDSDINDGMRLIQKLDLTDFSVVAALWFYYSDVFEWRLTIASWYLDKNGPKKAYGFLQTLLMDFDIPSISLENITLISPEHDLIKLLSLTIQTGPQLSKIRFTRNVINGQLIEDAYIYRINYQPTNRSSPTKNGQHRYLSKKLGKKRKPNDKNRLVFFLLIAIYCG